MVLNIDDYFLRRNNLAIRGLLGLDDLKETAKMLAQKLNIHDDKSQVQQKDIYTKLGLCR